MPTILFDFNRKARNLLNRIDHFIVNTKYLENKKILLRAVDFELLRKHIITDHPEYFVTEIPYRDHFLIKDRKDKG
jgi:hypothetical protein